MRVRTFSAADMPTAMQMVRDALGEDAIIISSEPDNRTKTIKVTAALDDEDDIAVAPRPQAAAQAATTPRDRPAADRLRYDVQNILRFHNVPELFVAKFMQKATESELASVLALYTLTNHRVGNQLSRMAIEALASSYFRFHPMAFDTKGSRYMLIGPPGIGKTLAVAKVAARLAMEHQPVAVITTDNKRAGGVEQLKAFTDILNVPLKVAVNRTELMQHIEALPARMPLMIDTAGVNPYDAEEMQEIKSYASCNGIEPVLVLPAGGDSLEAIDIVEPFMSLPVKKLLVTRADTARRFGGVLAAAAAHDLAFCNVSDSSSIVDTMSPMDSPMLAQLLTRYQLQTA